MKGLQLVVLVTLFVKVHSQQFPVTYFDGNFNRVAQNPTYYGKSDQSSKPLVTLYNVNHSKVAMLHYVNKDFTKKEGPATGFFINGDTQFVSSYIKNQLNGVWLSWFPNRQLCDSGRFRESAPEGLWKFWYPDGTLRMLAEFDSRKLWAYKEELNRSYRSFFKSRKGDKLPAGTPSVVRYNKMQYEKLLQAIQPDVIVGNAQGYSLASRLEYNLANNYDRYVPPFSECLINGLYQTFFADGTLKDSGYYINGSKEGVWKEWDENDQLRAIGFYRKGIRRGDWKFYDRHRKFLYIRRYNRYGDEKEKIEAG